MTRAGERLFAAIDRADAAAVETLLGNGAPREERDAGGNTPLLRALQTGHTALAQQLIDAGADIRARNDTGSTPFMYAAWLGATEVASVLFRLGAAVDEANDHGITALLGAVIGNREEMVPLLLQWGASPLAASADGSTACDYAQENMRLSRRGGDTLVARLDDPAQQKAARILALLKAAAARAGAVPARLASRFAAGRRAAGGTPQSRPETEAETGKAVVLA